MVNDYVIPRIKELYSKNLFEYKYLTIYGVPESNLSENINSEDVSSNNQKNIDIQEVVSESSDQVEITLDDIPEVIDEDNLDSEINDKE